MEETEISDRHLQLWDTLIRVHSLPGTPAVGIIDGVDLRDNSRTL